MQRIYLLPVFASIALVAACATKAPPPKTVSDAHPYVNHIELSSTTGQAGKPFRAQVGVAATHLHKPEFSISNLPEGLRFDKEKQMIVGVPTQKGFHTVTVAVREFRGKGVHWSTVKHRWFTEEFELRFFEPIDESEDDGGFGPLADADIGAEDGAAEDDMDFDF